MRSLKKLLVVLLLFSFGRSQAAEPLDVLHIAAPPEGLLALPVLHMVETQPLKEHGLTLEFSPWKNPEQLRALVLGGQTDVVSMNTVAAVIMSAKDVPLKLLGLSLGNVLHVLSSTPDIQSLEDLKGKTVAVPFKGEMPDLLFRAVIEKTPGLSIDDLTIRYTSTSRDAANLLAGGRVEAALIADPHSAILLEKAGKDDIPPLFDAINLQNAWNAACGKESPLPIAGVAAIGAFSRNEPQLNRFWTAYTDAVNWCIAHPEQAAALQAEALTSPETAAGIARATQDYIRPVTAADAREPIEQFMQLLRDSDPEKYKTAVPKPDFYWQSGIHL
jgi:NitT/TauT family transport system substrate-binding protein